MLAAAVPRPCNRRITLRRSDAGAKLLAGCGAAANDRVQGSSVPGRSFVIQAPDIPCSPVRSTTLRPWPLHGKLRASEGVLLRRAASAGHA